MHAVVRSYVGPGASDLFHLLEKRKQEVEELIGKVPGLVCYTLVRSAEGGTSVTVCRDRAGCDASVKIARDWVAEHAKGISVSEPTVSDGEVIVLLN